MRNIELLPDNVAQAVKGQSVGDVYFSTWHLGNAYAQLPPDETIRNQCSFSLIGGQATCVYHFQTGFYGSAVITADIQNAIELSLINCRYAFTFSDDILMVKKNFFKIIHKWH